MRLLSIQEASRRRFERQQRVAGLQYHAAGHCVHVGRLSPGCRGCFEPDAFRLNISCGERCNVACDYCFDRAATTAEQARDARLSVKARILSDARRPGYGPGSISFSGGGEPLCDLDRIEDYMSMFRALAPRMSRRPWFYLYTNGLLATPGTLMRLRDLGFDELRFHVGASGFSPKVFDHIRAAVALFPAVTVETPAWPPHRTAIFAMLPALHDLGVKHLNLGEVEITADNRERIAARLPDAEVYQSFQTHLYGGDLVYDVVEVVLARRYSYSVLDCSGIVKSLQRSPAKTVIHEPLGDAIAEYPGYGTERKAEPSPLVHVRQSAPCGGLAAGRMDAVYGKACGIVAETVEDACVLLEPDDDAWRQRAYRLNETGRAIWDRLDASRSLDAVARELASLFEVSEAELHADVAAFVGDLLRRGFVVHVPHPESPEP